MSFCNENSETNEEFVENFDKILNDTDFLSIILSNETQIFKDTSSQKCQVCCNMYAKI